MKLNVIKTAGGGEIVGPKFAWGWALGPWSPRPWVRTEVLEGQWADGVYNRVFVRRFMNVWMTSVRKPGRAHLWRFEMN